MPFLNPNGHDWANNYNLDGWGICLILFAILYTLFLLVCSFVLWQWRNHPVIHMRRPALAIAAVLMLHVYVIIILLVYPWNGFFPCAAEFWIMSIYLPIGIGLFQAQNQVLLLISRGQQILLTQDTYKSLPSGKNRRQYCWNAFILWCKNARRQDVYEGFLAAGMVIQVMVSLVIFLISRQFNSYGVVSQPTTPALCRRGWEWAPSIIWQAVWNYIAGPFLLYKIRLIRDIYNWRLQTTLAVVAGLPGTPLWLAAVYSDKLNAVSKYWVPAMWFAPGLIAMQLVAILGPLSQVYKSKIAQKETDQVLLEFADKKNNGTVPPDASVTTTSIKTGSSRGMMFNMESLDNCLNMKTSDYEPFHQFCAKKCFNSENVIFLDKAIGFKREWTRIFNVPDQSINSARQTMYRVAVNIYLTLINDDTANYAINIEGHIKKELHSLFRAAAISIASHRHSTPQSPNFQVTPWDEAPGLFTNPGNDHPLRPLTRHSIDKGSSSSTYLVSQTDVSDDPFPDFPIPATFSDACFDRAMASVKHMLWQQPWQEYMRSRRESIPSV
ncbi:MAG: hypothetical protein L6R35_005542 [Caloplaca aegaea]|nr:MAG: hypothetical protein L6R35_005542 [Caloplaca aegaea]